MAMSPITLSNRPAERAYLSNLNSQFQSYIGRVKDLRNQTKQIQDNTFIATVQSMENEIYELKKTYEKELEDTRYQLDSTIAEKNQAQLDANKNGTIASELKEKYECELNNRKKLENGLADAHRLLSEKDALIQDCRISIAQHQNELLDRTKERDALQESLSNTQMALDTELKCRADLEASVEKLSKMIEFEREVHEREILELKNKLAAAERAIEIADEKLREHDIVDADLHNMIANMRVQTHAEFQRFKDEAELAYQASLQTIKSQLDNESNNLKSALEENIKQKAIIEDMTTKIAKMEARCSSLEDHNQKLIQTLETERQQASNAITTLECKLREMQENLNTKIRELNHAHNASIPLDFGMASFEAALVAEERRLNEALKNPPSELYQSARGELLSSRVLTGRRSQPGSPRRPVTVIGSSRTPQPPLSRPKSTTGGEETKVTELPIGTPGPKMNSPNRYGGYLPYIGPDQSRFMNPAMSSPTRVYLQN